MAAEATALSTRVPLAEPAEPELPKRPLPGKKLATPSNAASEGDEENSGETEVPDEDTEIPAATAWELEDKNGTVKTFDARGLLCYTTDRRGHRTTLIYDEKDDVCQIKTPSGKRFDVITDEHHRITAITLPNGGELSYAYDENNNLISATDAEGGTRRYEYDANHCMTAWYDENGNRIVENVYDSNGRVTRQTDAEGNTATLEYQDGCTVSTDNRGNVTKYYIDEQKRISGIEYPDGSKKSYTYTADNRKATETDERGIVTSYTYDANGNLTAESCMNYAETSYQYDTENRLAAVYDSQRLLMAAVYDGDGNRTFQLNYNTGATCGYGRNTSGEVFMPEHSKNEDGSLTAEGQLFSYICSATGRAYDLTEYVNDTNRQYTEVLTAYTINSEATNSYSYAGKQRQSWNSIWPEARDVIQNETSFYLYDGRGSVTGITWEKSRVTEVYQYDPYGQVTLGNKEHVDFYGYNGESYNPNTGLEYLRARYYNANQGRFFQEDTYLGEITDPLTLNRYAYAKNSPLNYADPSGHTSVGYDKILSSVNKWMFDKLKNSAMKMAVEILGNASHGTNDSLSGMMIKGVAGGILVAVAFSESELCINPEELQLSIASFLMGMISENLYYGGTSIIGSDGMALLELLQKISGTDAEYDYAMKNLDAKAYYYGKEIVDIAYASLGETMSSPLAVLAQLVGLMGSGGGGSGSLSYGMAGNGIAGIELESGMALSNGLVIGVIVAGAAGAAGSNMQATGNARAEENRENREKAAEGESKPSNKPYKNNKEANKQAQKQGYKDAHELKEDYVGKSNVSKYDMKYDTKTGEIYLESKDGKTQIPTGLIHEP